MHIRRSATRILDALTSGKSAVGAPASYAVTRMLSRTSVCFSGILNCLSPPISSAEVPPSADAEDGHAGPVARAEDRPDHLALGTAHPRSSRCTEAAHPPGPRSPAPAGARSTRPGPPAPRKPRAPVDSIGSNSYPCCCARARLATLSATQPNVQTAFPQRQRAPGRCDRAPVSCPSSPSESEPRKGLCHRQAHGCVQRHE